MQYKHVVFLHLVFKEVRTKNQGLRAQATVVHWHAEGMAMSSAILDITTRWPNSTHHVFKWTWQTSLWPSAPFTETSSRSLWRGVSDTFGVTTAPADERLDALSSDGGHGHGHGLRRGQPVRVVVAGGKVADVVDVAEHEGHGAEPA